MVLTEDHASVAEDLPRWHATFRMVLGHPHMSKRKPMRPPGAPFSGLAFLTGHGYVMVMKSVQIAQLKARLSEYLRGVRRGHPLTVLDRQTPVAQIIPYGGDRDSLTIRRPLPSSPGLHRIPLPPRLKIGIDVVALLMEERQGER